MHSKAKMRPYQKKQIAEDLYQFEMGNELGAQLERNKLDHEEQYKSDVLSEQKNKKQKSNQMKD